MIIYQATWGDDASKMFHEKAHVLGIKKGLKSICSSLHLDQDIGPPSCHSDLAKFFSAPDRPLVQMLNLDNWVPRVCFSGFYGAIGLEMMLGGVNAKTRTEKLTVYWILWLSKIFLECVHWGHFCVCVPSQLPKPWGTYIFMMELR